MCRPARGECDLEERCGGGEALCPRDTFKVAEDISSVISSVISTVLSTVIFTVISSVISSVISTHQATGTGCGDGTGHCHSGRCGSHLAQCRLLWGPGVSVAAEECFQRNLRGDTQVAAVVELVCKRGSGWSSLGRSHI